MTTIHTVLEVETTVMPSGRLVIDVASCGKAVYAAYQTADANLFNVHDLVNGGGHIVLSREEFFRMCWDVIIEGRTVRFPRANSAA